MLNAFISLREDHKFLIIASIVCALILTVVITTASGSNANSQYENWAQLARSIQ